MSPRRSTATARRVLRQLRHDPRTIALILLVPSILVIILRFVFQNNRPLYDGIAPMMVGLFPFTLMFVVTSITTLRERTAGTLERLMTLPISKLDFVTGYALAFSLLALAQAALASWVMLGWLGVPVAGGAAKLLVVAILAGLMGETFGLLVSAFATSEFQAVQFLPALIFPQLLTCGLFIPRVQMARPLQWFADVMPLTYVVDAMKQVTQFANWSHALDKDLIIVGGYALAATLLSTLTLRRRQRG
jgi:ABC-2 type transport system permease protein